MSSRLKFDDYLGLSKQGLKDYQLIVFTGISGSGKTSYMEWLRQSHMDLSGQVSRWINIEQQGWPPEFDVPYLFIDEICRLTDLYQLNRLLRNGCKVVVANHIAPSLLKAVSSGAKAIYFRTDTQDIKLINFLRQSGIDFTESSLQQYCARYGLSYSPAQIMLEHTKTRDLGHAMDMFDRNCDMHAVSVR